MLNAFKTRIMLNVLFYNNLMVELEMFVSKLNKTTLNNKLLTNLKSVWQNTKLFSSAALIHSLSMILPLGAAR